MRAARETEQGPSRRFARSGPFLGWHARVLVAALVSACSGEVAAPRFEPLASPAPPGSLAPRLVRGRSGEVLLGWTEPVASAGRHRLRIAPLGEDGRITGELATAAEGADWFVNWADVPALASARDGRVLASWLAKSGAETYAYEVRLASRSPESSAFEERGRLHRDETPAEHGFVSFVPLESGELFACWLDGGKTPAGGATALRAALIDVAGRPREEWELDPRVCDCCPTSAALLSDGSLGVLYRDRSEDEVRDISIVRGRADDPSSWSAPRTVHDDGWFMPGCPVNGPVLAVAGRTVLAAWTTEAGGRPRVLVARSRDGGASFEPPLEIDEGRPLGRVELAPLAGGRALVVWLEADGEGASWRARTLSPSPSAAATIAHASAGRDSGRLTLVATPDGALAAWPSAEGVRLARVLP